MLPAAAQVAQGWSLKPVSHPGRCALIMAFPPLEDSMEWILLFVILQSLLNLPELRILTSKMKIMTLSLTELL